MKFTNEQLEKAKLAKSEEELLALAKENNFELTGEEAAKYYAELHREGKLADEELDNVAGGSSCTSGCTYSDDPPHYLIVTAFNSCPAFEGSGAEICSNCGWNKKPSGTLTMYCTWRTRDDDPYR